MLELWSYSVDSRPGSGGGKLASNGDQALTNAMHFLQKLLSLALVLGMLLIGMLFALQNTETVPLDLLIIQLPERSVALWVLLAFSVGAIAGMVASSGVLLKLRKDLFSTRSQLQRKSTEVDKLRSSGQET